MLQAGQNISSEQSVLPPKAVSALIDIKKELLSHEVPPGTKGDTAGPPREAKARPPHKKLLPQRVNGFQRMCQQRDWASPIY